MMNPVNIKESSRSVQSPSPSKADSVQLPKKKGIVDTAQVNQMQQDAGLRIEKPLQDTVPSSGVKQS